MLQCYRWREAQESLMGGTKMQTAKANTAFPDPLLPEARPCCFGARPLPQAEPLATKSHGDCTETKASGLVV